jgi:hypothetical protein
LKKEEMIKKSIYLLILFLVILLKDAASQNSQVLYYMNLPQNHLVNPAFKPTNSFYLGIPVLSGIDVTINNNFVNFSDVIMPGQKGDSLISVLHPDYNVDNFIKKLKSSNFIAPELSIQLFGLGFKAGKDLFVTVDVVDRVQGNFALPKDLFMLALKGNSNFVGKTMDLSGFDTQLKYWQEFGVGFSKNFGRNLRIGVRGKLLFGITNISMNNKIFGLTVNDDYSYDFNADITANISGPVKVYMKSNKNTIDSIKFDENRFTKGAGNDFDLNKTIDFFFNRQNMGLGIDIGGSYSIAGKIQISASITDLGFIRWKSDVTNLKANSTFKFSGFNVTDVVNGSKTFDQIAQDMVDSLKNSFTITNQNQPFSTSLPVGISIGGSYNLTKSISFGILSHSILTGKQIREALTLSANINLGNLLSTSFCYTAENGRFDNLGAGLAFRLGMFQFYFITDKIPVMWNKIKTDNGSMILPNSWNTFNTRLGMNLAFGNKVKKKNDKPMLMEQK